MATAAQKLANRANARKSTGPRTPDGKAAARMNALKHGMTAAVVVLPHEDATSYHELRAALVDSYAPANAHERMLVDHVAAANWRAIRARRFETALFDNEIRALKWAHDLPSQPDPAHDDEACAVILKAEDPAIFRNYFRYDGSVERQFFRAVHALERAQAARRAAARTAETRRRRADAGVAAVIRNAHPDTIAASSPEPPAPQPVQTTRLDPELASFRRPRDRKLN